LKVLGIRCTIVICIYKCGMKKLQYNLLRISGSLVLGAIQLHGRLKGRQYC
jgi:hypothetical protein